MSLSGVWHYIFLLWRSHFPDSREGVATEGASEDVGARNPHMDVVNFNPLAIRPTLTYENIPPQTPFSKLRRRVVDSPNGSCHSLPGSA